MHDKLKQGTKELPPLKIGDHVMLPNQLGNKPKRWDKREVVVQADPKTRQYNVMAFGSRRLTLRNRKFLRKYTPINTPAGTPTGLELGHTLGGQKPVQTTVPTNAPVIPAPVSTQPTACTHYTLPPAPVPVQHAVINQASACPEYSLPSVKVPAQHAGSDWGARQPMAVQPAYTQSPTQYQMPNNTMSPTVGKITMSPPGGNITMSPPVGNITMSPPVATMISMRATNGQTTKYDDFVQQITLKA